MTMPHRTCSKRLSAGVLRRCTSDGGAASALRLLAERDLPDDMQRGTCGTDERESIQTDAEGVQTEGVGP
jgi:hypothetical protein